MHSPPLKVSHSLENLFFPATLIHRNRKSPEFPKVANKTDLFRYSNSFFPVIVGCFCSLMGLERKHYTSGDCFEWKDSHFENHNSQNAKETETVFHWFISLLDILFFHISTFRFFPQNLIKKLYSSGVEIDREIFFPDYWWRSLTFWKLQ